MSRKITTIKTDCSSNRLNDLGIKVSTLFKQFGNIPEGYTIEEIQLDILKGETRIIINDE